MSVEQARVILGTIAPTLAKAIGGPLEPLAYRVVGYAVAGKEGAVAEEIGALVANAGPEQLLALKEAEKVFSDQLRALGVDLDALAAMSLPSEPAKPARTIIHAGLALLTLAAFFAYVAAVTFLPVADERSDFIGLAVGWLGGTASTVIAYYFGSSAGQDKNMDLLRQAGKGK